MQHTRSAVIKREYTPPALCLSRNGQAATMVCIAAAVELMCEPLALIFQYRLLIHVRGACCTVRCLSFLHTQVEDDWNASSVPRHWR